jgi:hypothetical protein
MNKLPLSGDWLDMPLPCELVTGFDFTGRCIWDVERGEEGDSTVRLSRLNSYGNISGYFLR